MPKVTKNLMSASLQAAVAGPPKDGRAVLRIDASGRRPVIAAESYGGTLRLENVPAEFVGQPDAAASATGSRADTLQAPTPMTLSIALIKTFARAVGASLSLHQSAPGRFELRVTMTPSGETYKVAPE